MRMEDEEHEQDQPNIVLERELDREPNRAELGDWDTEPIRAGSLYPSLVDR